MSQNTAISWTDHTINFWWGCTKVSPACQHCYAAEMGPRFGPKLFGQPVLWGPGKPRFERLQAARAEALKIEKQAIQSGTRPRVFVNSMSDWLRGLRDQCAVARVPFFFKQWGEWISLDNMEAHMDRRAYKGQKLADGTLMLRVGTKTAGHRLDGVDHHTFPNTDTAQRVPTNNHPRP